MPETKDLNINMHTICTSNTQVMQMVTARMELTDYSNKVLNVVKAKFALKDKSEALNRLIEIYGDDFVDKEATVEYIKKVVAITENHVKKYGNRKMTIQELDKLCGVK